MASRLLQLRRPPVIHRDDSPFVPTHMPLDAIDHAWDALCEANDAYFDGQHWHVIGVHRNGHGGASIHVQPCSYRFWAVQHALSRDLGVRPLGAKGIVVGDDGVLMGRRAAHVAAYPNQWEFAPGGTVESQQTAAQCIVNELAEETGLRCIQDPPAIAIAFDEVACTWEIIHRIVRPTGRLHASDEYAETRWVDASLSATEDLDLTPIARVMLPLAVAELRSAGLQ